MKFVTTPKIVVQKAPKTPAAVDKRPTIEEAYKKYLKSLNFEEYSIDRDGDLFRALAVADLSVQTYSKSSFR